jgi:outer membrane protein TolC
MGAARHRSSIDRRRFVILRLVLHLAPLLIVPRPIRAQTPTRTLELGDLQTAAERRSPTLRAAAQATSAAEAKLDEATISPFFQFTARAATGFAPNARGVPGFTQDSQVPTDQSWGPFFSGGVQGAIPIYTFGKISAARDAARAGVTSATLTSRRARNQLRFDVRRAYYALQLALDTLQMISEGRGKLTKAVRQLEQRIEDGDPDVDEFDAYRLQAALSEVEARGAEAHNLERAARAALSVLSGIHTFEIPDCPISLLVFEPGSMESHTEQARQSRPEVGMLGAAIQARRAELRAQKASYFPDLALALQASRTVTPGRTDQNDPFISDPANFTMLGAAVVAQWDLDLWGNSARVRGAEGRLAQTEAQSGQARDGIDLEIATAHAGLIEARERAQAWQHGHEQTRRWFVAAAQGYEIGAREPKDLIDALKAYFTARFSHLQSIHDHNVAVARLEQSRGAPVMPAEMWNQHCDIAEDSSDDASPTAAPTDP